MRKFCTLMKVSFWGMLYAMNLAGGSRKKRISGFGILVLAGALMLALSASYSFSLSLALAEQEALDLLPVLMSLTAVLLCTIFSWFGAQGILFNTRDMDLALSWPVTSLHLVLSRILALYLENLFLLGVWMLPVWIAWMWQGGCPPAAVIALPVGVVLLAFLPCLFSMTAGFLLALVTSRFAHKALIANLLHLVLLIAIFAGSYGLQRTAFSPNNPAFFAWPMLPFQWFTGVLKLQDSSLMALAAVCLLPFFLAAWIISWRYNAILTLLATHRARFDYKLTGQRSSDLMRALVRREFRRYFSISLYLFNTGIGLLFLALTAIAAVTQRNRIGDMLALLELDAFPLTAILALWVGFILAMTQPTSCSISLEGKQLWILKSAPLRSIDLFGSKILMQLAMVLPFLFVCVPALGWALGIGAAQTASLLASAISLAFCIAPVGLIINLCFPKLDAPNPTVVIKQSAATLVGLLAGFALLLPGVVLYRFFAQACGGCAWLLMTAFLYIVVCVASWRWLLTRGTRLLYEL